MRGLDPALGNNNVGGDENGPSPVRQYITDMRIANYSPVTIKDRVDLLERFRTFIERESLLDATVEDIRAFQALFVSRAPATQNIYARHLRAFFKWARQRRLIESDLAETVIVPKVARGLPHPTRHEDLRRIFACTTGFLRVAYVLAAFAGLRRGEICRLARVDLFLENPEPTALIHGKGGRERKVPIIAPVVAELRSYGLPRAGYVLRHPDGKPMRPGTLSAYSHNHLAELGVETTLHSMRHTFATDTARTTRDALFVRDLLGHQSVASSEIYMETTLNGAHARLEGVAESAVGILGAGRGRLRAVHGSGA